MAACRGLGIQARKKKEREKRRMKAALEEKHSNTDILVKRYCV